MKLKHNLNDFTILDCYNEKLNALNKVTRATFRLNKLYEEAHLIERNNRIYMEYIARLDKRIGEIHNKQKGII